MEFILWFFDEALDLLNFTYPHLLKRKLIPNRYQDGEIEKDPVLIIIILVTV